jgi:hypothetical protein
MKGVIYFKHPPFSFFPFVLIALYFFAKSLPAGRQD